MAIISPTILVVSVCGALIIYMISRLFRGKGNGGPLPPGPKGIPIFGNINDLPKPNEQAWQHWLQHKELYGAYKLQSQPFSVSQRP